VVRANEKIDIGIEAVHFVIYDALELKKYIGEKTKAHVIDLLD